MLDAGHRTTSIAPGARREGEGALRDRLFALAMQAGPVEPMALEHALTPDETAEIEQRLATGTSTSVGAPRSRSVVDAVLGIDFGTSSTKVVARLPFEAGTPAVAIPVPAPLQADAHPHLWRTCLWFGPDELLSLSPKPGASPLIGLKTGILALAGNPGAAAINDGDGDALACGFLALQIRQARGWLLARHSGVFGRGNLRWWINVGFPAASLDVPSLRGRYETIVAAALELAAREGPLTLTTSRDALASIGGSAAERLDQRNGALFPEIAAAVAGYAWSSRRRDGLFAMVDVGAATLDLCTFNLFPDQQGALRCPIFRADVSTLGVEVWRRCLPDAELVSFFPGEVRLKERTVVWDTKRSRYRLSDRWAAGLPVFLIGGGASSKVHVDVTGDLSPWLKQHGCGGAVIESLPPPRELTFQCGEEEVQRLAVAVGLSLFKTDIPQPTRPSDIEDDAPPRIRDTTGSYISKEMT